MHLHYLMCHNSLELKRQWPIDDQRKTRNHLPQTLKEPKCSKNCLEHLTWCARQIKSMLCWFKNYNDSIYQEKAKQEFVQWLTSFTILTPNLNETPASFSLQPLTSLSGLDHSRSQRRPDQWELNHDKNDIIGGADIMRHFYFGFLRILGFF